MDLERTVALICLFFWPMIPLFWIPTHLVAVLSSRRPGILPYVITPILYAPIGYLIYKNVPLLLANPFHAPVLIKIIGWTLFLLGGLLHLWTIIQLRIGIIGVEEAIQGVDSRLVETGVFRFSRHPTYFAHHMIFFGASMATGYLSLWVMAVLDLALTQFIIIPLEERELRRRIGKAYEEYMLKTPRILGSRTRRSTEHNPKARWPF